MAYPGSGFKSVLSMMIELSFHLIEPIIYTTTTTSVGTGGYGTGGYGGGGYGGGFVNPVTVTVNSLGFPVNALYPGAQIVVDIGLNQEIVSVISVNPATSSFIANFLFQHPVGTLIQGATFPVQAASGDPFFTQTEILSYIARAQNNFLADVPCIFGMNTQFVQFGQIYQQLICDAIELHHSSSSAQFITLVSLTRGGGSGYGTGGFGGGGYGGGAGIPNLVIAVSQSPHGLVQNQKFSIFNTPDPSFVGAFRVGAVIDGLTFSYTQDQPAAITNGGAAVLWKRLYLTSQEELSIQNPFWRNQNTTEIRSIYEDRSGNYRFGVDGKPSTNLPLSILVSTRDTDTLEMTDGFLVPDVMIHGVKYLALHFAWSKDGEQRNKLLADYSKMRYDRVVMASKRWMDGMGIDIGAQRQRVMA
jgi:hypothetical protein